MDKKSAQIIRKVWKHSEVDGYVWLPTIRNIGKSNQRFNNGVALRVTDKLPAISSEVDSYWTPAVRTHTKSPQGKPRDATGYGPQRVVWVDCDESFDDELLTKLRPSFMWETSPGHKQAVWLLSEPVDPSEFHKEGYMGMLTEALGGDPSGVDIPQLLRVPGSWHHKREEYHGRILRSTGNEYTPGQLLTRVARGLGLPAGLASELGADDPYGDRSKKLWQFARTCAELGLAQSITFKLIKACKWNKFKTQPERLKEDIERAYAASAPAPAREQPAEPRSDAVEEEQILPWELDSVSEFGPIIHTPMRWVLPGIIPEAGCGLIVAAPKVGKTRIAIEVALGLASGRTPLGINVKRPQAVGFFSLEDGEYLFAERLSDGMREGRSAYHWDGNIRSVGQDLVWDPPRDLPLLTGFKSIDLSTEADKKRLLETIVKYELKLVIIDTLSMAIGSSNVSDSKEMNGILKDVREIAKATRCAIMFIHHTRKRVFEKGESIQESILGSTALHAWTEFVLSLAAPEEGDDLMRLGIQTKRGGGLELVDQRLKIVKRVKTEED